MQRKRPSLPWRPVLAVQPLVEHRLGRVVERRALADEREHPGKTVRLDQVSAEIGRDDVLGAER